MSNVYLVRSGRALLLVSCFGGLAVRLGAAPLPHRLDGLPETVVSAATRPPELGEGGGSLGGVGRNGHGAPRWGGWPGASATALAFEPVPSVLPLMARQERQIDASGLEDERRNGKDLHTVLGIADTRFTVNGKPTFLLGISYYGALGAPEASIRADLAEMQRRGFNWIRVWATWGAFSNEVSAVGPEGRPREPFIEKLKWLIAQGDARSLVVDVTLSRGNGATGPVRLQTLAAHRQAVESVVQVLKPYRNWYLDLSNERNIRDPRFTSFEDLKSLRARVRELDPQRLVTASHAGDLTRDDLRQYVQRVRVDFLSPHRPRDPGSPAQTEMKTDEYLAWMKEMGTVVPVHYQEPFRRGFGPWQPGAKDFVTDACQARQSGAAGWCFHNGDQRAARDGQPRRSFDLRARRLFEQLDTVERQAVDELERSFRSP